MLDVNKKNRLAAVKAEIGLAEIVLLTWGMRWGHEFLSLRKNIFFLATKISRNFAGMVLLNFLLVICDLKDIDNPG